MAVVLMRGFGVIVGLLAMLLALMAATLSEIRRFRADATISEPAGGGTEQQDAPGSMSERRYPQAI